MTVEAALVMPFVLAVMLIAIYGSYYVYDRCLGTQDAYLLCMEEAAHKNRENRHEAARIEGRQAEQFGNKYVGISSIGGTAQCDGEKITYDGAAITGPGVSLVSLLLEKNLWEVPFHGSSRARDPAYRLRRMRRSAAVLRQLGGRQQEEPNVVQGGST